MDKMNKMEQASVTNYLKSFITKNLPTSQTRYVRTMPTNQKELLMKYLAKKNPKVNETVQLNLFQISQSVPTNFYSRSTIIKRDWKCKLNESSLLQGMCNSTNLNPSEKAKLSRILKSSRKVTNYSLTKKFLANLDSQISTYDGLISAIDFINRSPKKNMQEIVQDKYLVSAKHIFISDLSVVTNCHFFAIGYKGLIIPFTNSDFYFVNLYDMKQVNKMEVVLAKGYKHKDYQSICKVGKNIYIFGGISARIDPYMGALIRFNPDEATMNIHNPINKIPMRIGHSCCFYSKLNYKDR